jgi:hypothetical protein
MIGYDLIHQLIQENIRGKNLHEEIHIRTALREKFSMVFDTREDFLKFCKHDLEIHQRTNQRTMSDGTIIGTGSAFDRKVFRRMNGELVEVCSLPDIII